MRYTLAMSVILLSVLITGCSSAQTSAARPPEKEIIFFSNGDELRKEVHYYDALIELKNSYPNEFKHMKVIDPSLDKKKSEKFNIKESPALLIVYKNETIVKIKGNLRKEEIIYPVSEAIKKLDRIN